MAKWGEGDPRWIVEDRPDATNVNNWHWSEKNASSWSKDKLRNLLEGLVLIKPGLGKIYLKAPSCSGEATANNRKGKLIFFYEWTLKIEWTAEFEDAEAPPNVEGTINIPNLSEEFDPSEINVDVELKSTGDWAYKAKEFIRVEGKLTIQGKLEEYIAALKKEYATDLILPTSLSLKEEVKSKTILSKPKPNLETVTTPSKPANTVSSDLQVKDLSLSTTFKCTVEEIYRTFTVRELVVAFTRNAVEKLDVRVGGEFALFGGNITGFFDKLEENKEIVQRWRFREWPADYYSTVTLTFSQESDCSKVSLRQTNIPSKDYDKTKAGWHNYYFESIKRTFGFGATLM